MSKSTRRFPRLEHLHWARFSGGQAKYRLGTSQVRPPPPEVFDSSGTMPLVSDKDTRAPWVQGLASRYGVGVEEITVTAGVSEALYLAAMSLISAGDYVLAERPGYQSLIAVPAAVDGETVELPREFDGRLDPERAQKQIEKLAKKAEKQSRRLAAVFVSDLHNPTGMRLPDETIDKLASACEKAEASLVIDEVYRDSDPDRAIGTARHRNPKIIVLSSLTKAYGMGGLRAGWISAPRSKTEEFTEVQEYLSVQPSAPTMVLAARALESADGILEWARSVVATNRRKFQSVMEESATGFQCDLNATAGIVAFPSRPEGEDTTDESKVWLEKHDVEVVPGDFFGAPHGVRIGFGTDPEEFAEAINRWSEAARETTASMNLRSAVSTSGN